MSSNDAIDQWFEQAYDYLSNHKVNVSNDNKLKLYGLYKQSIFGDCNIPKPSLFEFVARAKWDAWNSLKGMPIMTAREGYVNLVESLNVGWSRQGEYAYQPDTEEEEETGTFGNSVSSMVAVAGQDESDTDDLFGYARQNNLDNVRKLIEEDHASVNSCDADGITALHYASDRGHMDMVKLLIQLGADINARSNDQETPLHYACISEQLEVAEYLVQQGCDVSAKDADNQLAIDQADSAFVEALKSKCPQL
ncbi:ankyrin repeat-containing domain protein [Radiomyces spectabilis]|uniref:ankyrin repeat-containing domain protein n=1 Tax=Radiomyces spectabilis TaxID=64574 RepID=UPI002220952B|nr:ankyrin repeat-containing domain protein [Radiomyces spectabilis]KAI8379382.1 ankyrin repeat-containing domain protein [Radiomyces spectabilis]